MKVNRASCWLAAAILGNGLIAQEQHLGPVVGLSRLGDSIYSASQGGIFVQQGAVSLFVAKPSFRISSLVAFHDPQSGHDLLLLGGGDPGESGTIALLDLSTRTTTSLCVSADMVYGVALHPNHREAAIACADTRVLSIDLPFLSETSLRLRQKHTADARAVTYSADGNYLASGGLDGVLLLASTGSPAPPLILQEHTAGIECIQFSPDSKHLASGARDARVRLHTVDGRFVRTYSGLATDRMETGLGKKPYVWSLAWNRDASILIAGTSRGTLHRLSQTDDTFTTRNSPATAPVFSLSLGQGNRLFVGTETVTEIPLDF